MEEQTVKNDLSWLRQKGRDSDVVISSRVRLARNIKGIPFPHKAREKELFKVVKKVNEAVKQSTFFDNSVFVDLGAISTLERLFLMEKYLISFMQVEQGKGKYVIYDDRESFSIMINEEDHMRLSVLRHGFAIKEAWQSLNKIDDILNKSIEYSYSLDYGYLTSCPTNIGTGMRASIMVHLGALSFTDKLKDVLNCVADFGFTIRGLYGEGSCSRGNLYQISGKRSMGLTEKEIVAGIEKVTREIIKQEKKARRILIENKKIKFEDFVWRSYGILKNAKNLTVSETIDLLCVLRTGILSGFIPMLMLEQIDELIWISQPAHLFCRAREEKSILKDEDILRADLIKKILE